MFRAGQLEQALQVSAPCFPGTAPSSRREPVLRLQLLYARRERAEKPVIVEMMNSSTGHLTVPYLLIVWTILLSFAPFNMHNFQLVMFSVAGKKNLRYITAA